MDEESAIVVRVPEVEHVVGAFRRHLDPSAAWGMPAHVTLLYPFLPPAKIDNDVLAQLRGIFGGLNPFDQEFASTRWFGDQVLWLAPEPDSVFRRMTAALCAKFPEVLPYDGTISDPTPHLTIADGASLETMRDADSRVSAQLPIPMHVSGVSLMVGSNEIGSWRTIAEIPLKQT